MDNCKYCGKPLTWFVSIKSTFTYKIWKPTTVTCPYCKNKNYRTGKSEFLLILLFSAPVYLLINDLAISKWYKLVIILVWGTFIGLLSPFINKYRTEEEYKEDR